MYIKAVPIGSSILYNEEKENIFNKILNVPTDFKNNNLYNILVVNNYKGTSLIYS